MRGAPIASRCGTSTRRIADTSRLSFITSPRQALVTGKGLLLETSDASLDLLEHRPVVVDHPVHDAVHQRDRALLEDVLVTAAHSRIAVMERESPSCTVTR